MDENEILPKPKFHNLSCIAFALDKNDIHQEQPQQYANNHPEHISNSMAMASQNVNNHFSNGIVLK